jgi:hypothetical protein
MESAAITRDFYDRLNDPRRVLGFGVAFAFLIPALIIAVRYSDRLIKDHDAMFVLLCWILLPAILFRLPGVIRDFIQAYRGVPALRFGERGIWSRRWPHLGWIKWGDIAAVVIVNTRLREKHIHELNLALRPEEYGQFAWNDRVSQLFIRLLGCLSGDPAGLRMLLLTSSLDLPESWDDLMAALDPILVAKGIRKQEDGAC